MSLPSGLTTRPLEVADAQAVYELMADQERADIGRVEIEEEDIVAEWQRPSYDVSSTSIAVLDGDRIVAYAERVWPERYDVGVHPDVRGRGIGTWLAAWMREHAREQGDAIIGMPVPQGSPGDRLLTALGYEVRWTSWVLRLPPGATIAERPLPEGYAIREATPDDHEAVWTVVEDAFLEWADRERTPFDDFAAMMWQRPGFEPWHLHVVTDPAGAIVGVAHAWNNTGDGTTAPGTYVDRLAVAKDQRGRGLAQALLVVAFAAGREHGAATSCLSTDSRTGALSLYEKVGMVAESTWLHRAIRL